MNLSINKILRIFLFGIIAIGFCVYLIGMPKYRQHQAQADAEIEQDSSDVKDASLFFDSFGDNAPFLGCDAPVFDEIPAEALSPEQDKENPPFDVPDQKIEIVKNPVPLVDDNCGPSG